MNPSPLQTLIRERLAKLDSASKFTADDCESFYAMAHGVYQSGNWLKARDLFSLLRIFAPTDARFVMGLAGSQQMLGEYDEAAASWAFAALLEPDRQESVIHMAECLALSGRPDEAAVALRTVTDHATQIGSHGIEINRARALIEALARKAAAEAAA